METANEDQPLQGQALAAVLEDLARIHVLAASLKLSLAPLEQEDIELGAEPLSTAQIQDELDEICRVVTDIVVTHLKVESQVWYAANDAIE